VPRKTSFPAPVPCRAPISLEADKTSRPTCPDTRLDRFCGKAVGRLTECLSFWEKNLHDLYVLDVIRNGYRIPISKDMAGVKYREDNNANAKKEEHFVIDKVKRLIAEGLVIKTSDEPLVISPLSVAIKIKPSGEVRKRLVLDCSRHLNLHLPDDHIKMSTFATVIADLYEGDYMASCDLSAAFHHVRLHPELYKYVGFALDLVYGRGVLFFHFCILVFGLKTAGQTLTRVLKPIILWLGQDGVRLKFYINDGIVSARGKAKADKDYARVLDTLQAAGFRVAMDKSNAVGTASCRIEYLGLIIDSRAMTISVPPAKMAEVRSVLKSLLAKSKVTVRELSSVVGKVVALEPATGPSVLVGTRMASNLVAETSRKYGWGLWVFCILDDKVKSALREVHRRLPEWDSHPVRSDQTSLTLAAILPGDSMAHLERKIPNFRLQRKQWAIALDASETKVA
jgi:hypothetical protein